MTEDMSRFYKAVERFRDFHIFSMIPEITRVEFSVLKSIEFCEQKDHKGACVSKIAQAINQAPPMVSRALNSLEKKRLIIRKIDSTDRRNTIVKLTEEGRTMICRAEKTMIHFGEEVFEEYGHEEIDALIQKIDTLHGVMQHVMERKMEERQKGETNE